MSDQLPAEVTVTEWAGRVSYRLPRRRWGPYGKVGLALLCLGPLLCTLALLPAGKVAETFLRQASAEQGMVWLFVTLLASPLLAGGLSLARTGLLMLAGHSEIELRGGRLRACERCGPIRRAEERSTTDLRRFLVSDSLPWLKVLNSSSTAPEEAACVLTPEWKPAVGGRQARPMQLAPGYPRCWLLALGRDLAARSSLPAASPPTAAIAVLEKDPGASAYEELHEQPSGSRITAEETSEGLVLTVPPPEPWQRSKGILGGLFVCLVAVAISCSLFGEPSEHSRATTAVCAGVAWLVGVALVLAGINRARRRVTLRVGDSRLTVWQTGLLGIRQRQWSREQLADVFVMHHLGDSDQEESWELQVHPRPGEGNVFGMLGERDISELRWLATLLRHRLRCPGQAPSSPPPGLVVRSPWLVPLLQGQS